MVHVLHACTPCFVRRQDAALISAYELTLENKASIDSSMSVHHAPAEESCRKAPNARILSELKSSTHSFVLVSLREDLEHISQQHCLCD